MFTNIVEQFSSTSFNVQFHSKSHFLMFRWNFMCLCSFLLALSGYHREEPGFVLYAPSHQLFKKQSRVFSRLNTPSSLSLFSYVRCYNAFNNLCHSLDQLSSNVPSSPPRFLTSLSTFCISLSS